MTFGSSSQRYCTVSVVMADGRVDRVNYSGPTGGLVTEGEQAWAIALSPAALASGFASPLPQARVSASA